MISRSVREPTVGADSKSARPKPAHRLLLVASLLLVAVAYGPHLTHSSDDAYITYRYARNLADGHGLVFNHDESHLATTAPGWAVLLAAIARVTTHRVIPLASGVLSLAALLGSTWLLSSRLRAGDPLVFPVTCCLLAANRWLIEVLGHEGFAQTLLALLAIELIALGSQVLSGLAWAGAVFIRPDAGVMAAVSGLFEWLRARRFPLRLLGSFLVAAACAAVVLQWCAGSIVPQSLQVKLAEATQPLLAVAPPFWTALFRWVGRIWGWFFVPLGVLALLGWVHLLGRRRTDALRVLLPAVAMLVFYPIIGVTFAPWYLVFPMLSLTFGAAVAVAEAVRRSRRLGLAAVALAVLSAVPPVLWEARHLDRFPDPRAAPMMAAGRWISARACPRDQVAAIEVGFLGYACDQPIMDLFGLVSPDVLPALTRGSIDEYFLEHEPRFLVDNDTFHYILGPLLASTGFHDRYECVWTYPEDDSIRVWERVGAAEMGSGTGSGGIADSSPLRSPAEHRFPDPSRVDRR